MIPTQRTSDVWGSGAFGASRGRRKGGTEKKHKGRDLGAYPGMPIITVCSGIVTKLGYPYNPASKKKGHLRYVQVLAKDGYDYRYFYVKPTVHVGDVVTAGDQIGKAQGLRKIYPGIVDHIHFEVLDGKKPLNPSRFLS